MAISRKRILCVDDDEDDRMFLSQAISDVNPNVQVVEAVNGIDAIKYLDEMKQGGQHLPCLIVLDINMPLLDGKKTLERIKKDPRLKSIPVVVFTNSRNPSDMQLFKNYGVDMVSKPDNLVYLNKIATELLSYCETSDFSDLTD